MNDKARRKLIEEECIHFEECDCSSCSSHRNSLDIIDSLRAKLNRVRETAGISSLKIKDGDWLTGYKMAMEFIRATLDREPKPSITTICDGCRQPRELRHRILVDRPKCDIAVCVECGYEHDYQLTLLAVSGLDPDTEARR